MFVNLTRVYTTNTRVLQSVCPQRRGFLLRRLGTNMTVTPRYVALRGTTDWRSGWTAARPYYAYLDVTARLAWRLLYLPHTHSQITNQPCLMLPVALRHRHTFSFLFFRFFSFMSLILIHVDGVGDSIEEE